MKNPRPVKTKAELAYTLFELASALIREASEAMGEEYGFFCPEKAACGRAQMELSKVRRVLRTGVRMPPKSRRESTD